MDKSSSMLYPVACVLFSSLLWGSDSWDWLFTTSGHVVFCWPSSSSNWPYLMNPLWLLHFSTIYKHQVSIPSTDVTPVLGNWFFNFCFFWSLLQTILCFCTTVSQTLAVAHSFFLLDFCTASALTVHVSPQSNITGHTHRTIYLPLGEKFHFSAEVSKRYKEYKAATVFRGSNCRLFNSSALFCPFSIGVGWTG